VKKTTRFVIWICSKFTRREIEQIIQGLSEVLANRNPEVKPKDDFKEKHPNYRNFFVDPEPPLKAPPQKAPKLNWKELLSNYQKEKGHPLLPVNNKDLKTKAPKGSLCGVCGAPSEYLYFNDVKSAPSLSVRSALLYHRYILVIGIKLAIFALTVAIHFIFGKNEKRSLSINVTMISVHIF